MHIITLSFDDGFIKSFKRIAEIHEQHGLSACLNIIATGHLLQPGETDGTYKDGAKGDFDLWNELKARGHEIMPHGNDHSNKAEMPFEEATRSMDRCLKVFEDELEGFERQSSIFNFPYLASTPETESWLEEQVRAYRTMGDYVMPLPYSGQKRITSTSYGPGNAEDAVEKAVAELLNRPDGWLVFCLHGLDDEGWGPVGSDWLDRFLGDMVKREGVQVLPALQALDWKK